MKKPIPPRTDDWISQAQAARIRGVSRQAISKLVNQGRLRTLVIGGHVFVSRSDVVAFLPRTPGRPPKLPQ
ncbi:MAG: helix-turn-helix domain-containing protein [Pseudomonadota bacterium]